MNVNCNLTTCSFILNSKCVFYESSALPYTGIATNDSVEVALQKIEEAFSTVGSGIVVSIEAGTGISIGGTAQVPIVTNTLPDQTVVLNDGTGISVTGTYPNFTITNTSPGSGGITNSAVANELMKSDGTNAVSSGIFSTSNGSVILGSASIGGNRTISVANSATDCTLTISSKGAGSIVTTMTASTTNSIENVLIVERQTSGIPVQGIGAAIAFRVEDQPASVILTGLISSVITDVTGGSEDADMIFSTLSGGTTPPAERLRITSDGRLYGTALHNNAGAVTGTTNQYIASGTYTPTLTSVANIASSSAVQCQWIRVGNVVHVSGWFNVTATAAAPTSTVIAVSLPIASNLAANENLAGVGAFNTSSGVTQYATIGADTVNDRATVSYQATSAAGTTCIFTFTYLIL